MKKHLKKKEIPMERLGKYFRDTAKKRNCTSELAPVQEPSLMTPDSQIGTTTCVCGNPKTPNALSCHACAKALLHDIAERLTGHFGQPAIDLENYTLEKLVSLFSETFTKMDSDSVGTCCICGGNYVFGGYDPFPIVDNEDSLCCRLCNSTVVRDARFSAITNRLTGERNAKELETQ